MIMQKTRPSISIMSQIQVKISTAMPPFGDEKSTTSRMIIENSIQRGKMREKRVQ